MMINFVDSGHLVFEATSPLERGGLKSKGGGKKTIHGAVADLCNEIDPDDAESVICESLVIPTESANDNTTSQSSTSLAQGNLLQLNTKDIPEILKFQKVQKTQKTQKSNLATSFPYITRLCTSHGERLLDRKKFLRWRNDR